jgi:2-polyprenyl-3-methyl-5-hydroxy-6-metoxy-1,4-benzoquinol methylase
MNSRSVLDITRVSQGDATIRCSPRPYCLLCGAEGYLLYGDLFDWLCDVPGRWGMRRCRACDVAWLDPQPGDEAIPKLYPRYHTHRSAQRTRFDPLRQKTRQLVLARMGYPVEPAKGIIPRILSHTRASARAAALDVMDLAASEAGTLLDVGCGNGEFMMRMHSLGWTVSGVDPDPAAVAQCQSYGLQVSCGSILNVCGTGGYDAITLGHVIEHVVDPLKLLRECRERLRPETGRLIITTPNIDSLGHWWFRNYWRGLETPRHLNLFSLRGFARCATLAGLRLVSLATETRMARLIYTPSVYGKKGGQNVGERTGFRTRTKVASYLFQLLEDALVGLKPSVGEEIFCVCAAPAKL